MLRSAFVSLFWSIISRKKQHGGFSLKTLADKIGVHKSSPSRWFSGGHPNWTVNTIADIADALDVDLELKARDRQTGETFAPCGMMELAWTSEPPVRSRRTITPSLASSVPVKRIGDKPAVSLVLEDA